MTLAELKSEFAIVALEAVMTDENETSRVRWSAARALGIIGSNRATLALIRVVVDEEDDIFRYHAVMALRETDPEVAEVFPAELMGLSTPSSAYVRAAIAERSP